MNDESDPTAATMTLSDVDLERYARHVIIPGVGARGQTRLARSRVEVAGAPVAAQTCRLALERSGVRIVGDAHEAVDCFAIVAIDDVEDALLRRWGAARKPLVWVALRPGALVRGHEAVFAGDRPLPRRRSTTRERDPSATALGAYDTAGRVLSVLLGWDQSLVSTELRLD